MKRPYFYVIAWQPQAESGADRALIFRSTLVMALTEEIAYAVGQDWAEREKILPLPGPGNDYVISVYAALEMKAAILGAEDFPAFIRRVQAWHEETFKQKTPNSITKHLAKEVIELSESHKPSEAADCLLLLIGHAGECGYNLLEATRDKFAEVQERKWGPVNVDGFQEHVREPEDGK